jgi:hypothetical protein
LIFEKSSCKNRIRQTGFLACKFFAGCTGSKNPVQNRLKIQFVEIDFSKLIFPKSSTDQQGARRQKRRIFQQSRILFCKEVNKVEKCQFVM